MTVVLERPQKRAHVRAVIRRIRSRYAGGFRGAWTALTAAAIGACPRFAMADGSGAEGEGVTAAWTFTPDIVVGVLLLAALYIAGVLRQRPDARRVPPWRHGSFCAGLGAIFLALQSPLDALAEYSFAAHQVQHLLLHALGPMFLALSAPGEMLIAGTPVHLRRRIVQPVLTSTSLRRLIHVTTRPWPATALFVGSLYFWQLPRYHELAVIQNGVHYLMHVTMLVTGFVFFWCVFDRRPAPLGARYGARVTMLWAAAVGNILLGSVLTLKRSVVYPVYGEAGRLWGLVPLDDERLGGFIIWVPGSMMLILPLLVIIASWSSRDMRVHDRLRRGLPTVSGVAPRRNRALALRLAMLALTVFAAIIGVAVLVNTMRAAA